MFNDDITELLKEYFKPLKYWWFWAIMIVIMILDYKYYDFRFFHNLFHFCE